MSTIQMEITVCTCCYRPVEDCKIAQKWIRCGIPAEWITEERLYPEDVKEGDSRSLTTDLADI